MAFSFRAYDWLGLGCEESEDAGLPLDGFACEEVAQGFERVSFLSLPTFFIVRGCMCDRFCEEKPGCAEAVVGETFWDGGVSGVIFEAGAEEVQVSLDIFEGGLGVQGIGVREVGFSWTCFFLLLEGEIALLCCAEEAVLWDGYFVVLLFVPLAS